MKYYLALIGLILLAFGCENDPDVKLSTGQEEVPEALPFNSVSLEDLSSFANPTNNWSIVGQVIADHESERSLSTQSGTGVLVNQPNEENKGHLMTAWSHGDLELEVEFMVPKGSNSGIYFQGRYEVQLLDSWLKEQPTFGDVGGIYERWDESKPEGERGYEGYAPKLNAAKAPGLWQKLYVAFKAPRFNDNGEKISDAVFEKVVLNGVTIHENQSVSGPTRAAIADEEVAEGALMIQGDHGPVAFRNFRYKKYYDKTIEVNDLKYEFFAINESLNQMPDFDTLTATASGSADSIDILKLSTQEDKYAFRFTGNLNITAPGDYLMSTISDDGSILYIDGTQVVNNDENHGMQRRNGLIRLDEGNHSFQLDYYNNTWGKGLILAFEGPEMRFQPILSKLPETNNQSAQTLPIDINEQTELIRGFMDYGGKKRTHVLAVGQPTGVHYAVDLKSGALLNIWRGDFVDVGEMWIGRGHSQRIAPLGMPVEGPDGPLFAIVNLSEQDYPSEKPDAFKLKKYLLDDYGTPTFTYGVEKLEVNQAITGTSDGQSLIKTISIPSADQANAYCLLGKADYISKLDNGYFSVGGQYFIQIMDEGEPILHEQGDETLLLLPIQKSNNPQSFKYKLLW